MVYYKATQSNMTNCGLARAPIMQYFLNKWVYPDKVSYSKIRDGLWVGKHKGFIAWLRRYVRKTRGYEIRVFECEIGVILYQTSNRIKTDKVMLTREITS